jgi:hypothetical protein
MLSRIALMKKCDKCHELRDRGELGSRIGSLSNSTAFCLKNRLRNLTIGTEAELGFVARQEYFASIEVHRPV